MAINGDAIRLWSEVPTASRPVEAVDALLSIPNRLRLRRDREPHLRKALSKSREQQ